MGKYQKVDEEIPGCSYVKLRVWYFKDTNKPTGAFSIRWGEGKSEKGKRLQPELTYRDRQEAILKALEVDERLIIAEGKKQRSLIKEAVNPKRKKIIAVLEEYLSEKILALKRRNPDRVEETHEKAIRKAIESLVTINKINYIDEIEKNHLKLVDYFVYPKQGKSMGPRNVEKIQTFLRWCADEDIEFKNTLLSYKVTKPPAKENNTLTKEEVELIHRKFDEARHPVIKPKGVIRWSVEAMELQRTVQRRKNINATRGVDLLTRRYTMRCPEIGRLRIRDWDSKNRILTCIIYKGKRSQKPRVIKRHLDEYTAAELDLCCGTREKHCHIFVSPKTGEPWKRGTLSLLMNEIYKFFGVKATFYRGKHTVMTNLLEQYGELGREMAVSLSGHQKGSTSQDRYFVVEDEITRKSKMAQEYFNKMDSALRKTNGNSDKDVSPPSDALGADLPDQAQ